MAAAKLALKNAIESQNVEAQIAAQEQLANLTVENARLNAMKIADEEESAKEKEVRVTPQQQQPHQPADPKAEEWATKNKWFGENQAMTFAAFGIHKELVEQGEDPSSDHYYARVDEEIRKNFPQKFSTKISPQKFPQNSCKNFPKIFFCFDSNLVSRFLPSPPF